MTTEGEGEGMVGGASRERREECSVLSVSLEMALRRVLDKNASLTAAVSEYKMRVKNSEKKADEEEQNGLALL